jgi:hypothetical protein
MPTRRRPHRGRTAVRRPATGARVAAGLVVGLVALMAGCSADHSPDGGDRASTTVAATPTTGKVRAPSPTGSPSAGAGSPSAGTASPGGSPGGKSSGSKPSGGASSGTTTPGTGSASEVLPPTGSTPGALVIPTPDVPRLTGPLPATASARGALVTGFPVAIVPVPAGATIVSSSVAAEGSRLQVGLEASTAASPADVLAGYVQAFTAAGFITTDSPAGAGTTATAFVRENDGLVLTLRARLGGGTELSVAGTLVAQG